MKIGARSELIVSHFNAVTQVQAQDLGICDASEARGVPAEAGSGVEDGALLAQVIG